MNIQLVLKEIKDNIPEGNELIKQIDADIENGKYLGNKYYIGEAVKKGINYIFIKERAYPFDENFEILYSEIMLKNKENEELLIKQKNKLDEGYLSIITSKTGQKGMFVKESDYE